MKLHHAIILILVALVAYGAGIKFPAIGQKVLAKIGM